MFGGKQMENTKEYIYIVKTQDFPDVVETAKSSREAAYKAFKSCKEAGYRYNWLEFRKQVISAKRFKDGDLDEF